MRGVRCGVWGECHTVLVRGGLWLGAVVAVGGGCWVFLWVSARWLLSPLFVAGLLVCHCGFGLWWLRGGRRAQGLGALWRFFWGILWGFFLMGVLLWR